MQKTGVLTKPLLVMKLTILFLIAGLLNVQAKSYSQTVTFSGKNVAITKVFNAIEAQTGYTVFANKELLRKIRPVTLAVKDMPLNDFLSTLLNNQPVGFEIINRTIFITVKNSDGTPAAAPPVTIQAEATPRVEVNGQVLGENAEPLAGATVAIKGISNSVMTNAEGRFSI